MNHKLDWSEGYGNGLAATNAMALTGIKVGDRLLSVISYAPTSGATPNGRAVSDFTVSAGAITAATIDLTGLRFQARWTSVAGS